MTIAEVLDLLEGAGIRPNAYDLDKTQKDEVYCLEKSPPGWNVYYRERGIHRDERKFSSEDDACEYFLELVLADPTTRSHET